MIEMLPKPEIKSILEQVEFKGGTEISDQDLEREGKILDLEQKQQRFEIELARVKLDLDLKKATALRVFTFLGIETLLVLIIVMLQGFKPYGFTLLDTTLNIFVTATVIQISTMAVIITKHLFPTEKTSS